MAAKIVSTLNTFWLKFEEAVTSAILRKLEPGICIAGINSEPSKPSFNVKDIWNEGFLWAVPKHKRSLEKRLSRKFGWPKYNWKPLVPKTNLIMCRNCGHYHESYTICGTCYDKVAIETKEIQKAMVEEFKLDPVKDDFIVLYEGETVDTSSEYWKGQRIVELPKQRPAWFHQNLLEKSTQKLSDNKEVKPNDLA